MAAWSRPTFWLRSRQRGIASTSLHLLHTWITGRAPSCFLTQVRLLQRLPGVLGRLQRELRLFALQLGAEVLLGRLRRLCRLSTAGRCLLSLAVRLMV